MSNSLLHISLSKMIFSLRPRVDILRVKYFDSLSCFCLCLAWIACKWRNLGRIDFLVTTFRPIGSSFLREGAMQRRDGSNERRRRELPWGSGGMLPRDILKITFLRLHFGRFEGCMMWKKAAKSELNNVVIQTVELQNWVVCCFVNRKKWTLAACWGGGG